MNAIEIDVPLRYWLHLRTSGGFTVPIYRLESYCPMARLNTGDFFFPAAALKPLCRRTNHSSYSNVPFDDDWTSEVLFKAGAMLYQAVTAGTPEGVHRHKYFVRTDDVTKIFCAVINGVTPQPSTYAAQQSLDWWYTEALAKITAKPDENTTTTGAGLTTEALTDFIEQVEKSTFTDEDLDAVATHADKLVAADVPKNTAVIAALKIRAKETGKDFSAILKLVDVILK